VISINSPGGTTTGSEVLYRRFENRRQLGLVVA
jgi:ClpP class serine protease